MRLVVKIGTQVIVGEKGINHSRVKQIIGELAGLLKHGHEIVLVSSGAIGTGRPLIHSSNPLKKKVAAAIGQPLLMQEYIKVARKYKIIVGQVLMLSDDLINDQYFKNFLRNMRALLACKILPIINENDFMKRQDLIVNDNDMLGAMVAIGLEADKLIILTNQNGLYTDDPARNSKAELIKEVAYIDSQIEAVCAVGKSGLGVGGMTAKVCAAKYATQKGVETLIGNGEKRGTITEIFGKNFPGTRFLAKK